MLTFASSDTEASGEVKMYTRTKAGSKVCVGGQSGLACKIGKG